MKRISLLLAIIFITFILSGCTIVGVNGKTIFLPEQNREQKQQNYSGFCDKEAVTPSEPSDYLFDGYWIVIVNDTVVTQFTVDSDDSTIVVDNLQNGKQFIYDYIYACLSHTKDGIPTYTYILDDKSTDNTVDVVIMYAYIDDNYDRIALVANFGVSMAMFDLERNLEPISTNLNY